MGGDTISWIHSLAVILGALLAVFLESTVGTVRNLLGAQIDLLPALIVYCGLTTGLATLTLVAVLGGLWFDSLSANPLGVSILPLFVVGWLIHLRREVILRDQLFAQMLLGLGASFLCPFLNWIILSASTGPNMEPPVLGWGRLWQWLVMGLGGAVFVPVFFRLYGRLDRALLYPRSEAPGFRSDRVIIRGKK